MICAIVGHKHGSIKRGAQVMRDMKAHYAEVEANGGFSVRFPGVEG